MRPQQQSFNLNQVLIGYLLAIVIITGWAVWESSEYDHWQQAQNAAKRDLDTARQTLQQISAELDAEPDRRLVQQAENLQKEIRAQAYLLGRLDSQQHSGQGTYAQLLEALAQHHHQDIWLTQITLSQGKLQLEGRTLNAESVPAWLQGLSQSEYFTGTEFGSLKVFRDEDRQLNFVLGAIEVPSPKAARVSQ
ncbi:PilN domain-containing protein [Lacimicrobium sp. SS2-24]|uniref:PilN domain-containing protein n=1 Tax=Lacimicrobium sp. SS2-24 TaxID=2005569 RepID=UPI0014389EA4|nr:PilN domain-containing protein [Lacimicrobium sp. SS2-24]